MISLNSVDLIQGRFRCVGYTNNTGYQIVHCQPCEDFLAGWIIQLAVHLWQMIIPFQYTKTVLNIAPSHKIQFFEICNAIFWRIQCCDQRFPCAAIQLKADYTKCHIYLTGIIPCLRLLVFSEFACSRHVFCGSIFESFLILLSLRGNNVNCNHHIKFLQRKLFCFSYPAILYPEESFKVFFTPDCFN